MTPSGDCGGGVGKEGGEVEARALTHRAEDGWWRVRGHGLGTAANSATIAHAHRRAQVALVGRDAGVDRRRNERARLGWRDEERFGARPTLDLSGLAISILLVLWTTILEVEREEEREERKVGGAGEQKQTNRQKERKKES